ncbi:MAG: TIGR02611 family protein [Candidatus Microsaccharimonas sossegonensis]|uniref:TIGR02611 family protein n=1 Tax=Candidatus Microsaccharimonas sossegonensis TaxID=2506948 RepID=A0A4Q0AJP8_9BACT|nr:MAG: TIGR02611 family protein [Candidatus Microsaccharimonas sossegonensis]
MHKILRHGKRIGTAIVGGLVTIIGVILIPYPGPGWLIVFAGLAILATEFQFAAKWLTWLKAKYLSWQSWLKRQPKVLQLLILGATGLVILVTIWLLNTFGLIDDFFQWNVKWLHSPILRS